MKLRQMFRDRPWLFVVFGLGMLVALSLSFLVIALLNPPHLIR